MRLRTFRPGELISSRRSADGFSNACRSLVVLALADLRSATIFKSKFLQMRLPMLTCRVQHHIHTYNI